MKKTKESGPNRETLLRYIHEIDRFAELLRGTQDRIKDLEKDCSEKREAFEAAKAAVREEKDVEHTTVSMLLKFIAPGSIETFPLFDQMEPADEDQHGANAEEWRKEPITALRLSAEAMRLLVDTDVVLVGQLQDLMLAAGMNWHERINGMSRGLADAVQLKFDDFVYEQVRK